MDIYLIRHTSIQIDNGICYGQSDLPLSDSFESEFNALKEHIPGQFDIVYSSPSKRCRQLAKRLKAKQYSEDERLMELKFGDWEMKRWDDIKGQIQKRWMDDFVNICPPNGESFLDLKVRVDHFFKELYDSPFDSLAVVSHAGVFRTIICSVLGMPLKNAFHLQFKMGSVSLITIKDHLIKIGFFNK